MPEWIKAQKVKESHTLTISMDVVAGDGLETRVSERAKQLLEAIEKGENWLLYVDGTSGYTLHYIVPGKQYVGAIPINKDGILGQLETLGREL